MRRLIIILMLLPALASAQSAEVRDWTVDIGVDYQLTPDITYTKSNSHESKLDVIAPRGEGSHPTLLYIHGGGWVGGNKEGMLLHFLPYMELGYAIVNVEYRLADVATRGSIRARPRTLARSAVLFM